MTLSLTWALTTAAEPPVIEQQFDGLNAALRACPDVSGPLTVRAGLVLWPNGAWGVALGDWRAIEPGIEIKARACLDGWLQQHTRERLELRPTNTSHFERTLLIPSRAEWVTAVLDVQLGNIATACKRKLAPPLGQTVSAKVQLTVQKDGSLALTSLDAKPAHQLSPALVTCARQQLTGFSGGTLEEPLVVERRLSILRKRVKLPSTDGNLGDVCSFGEANRGVVEDGDELVEPAPCKLGLTCCSGGAAGSHSTCWPGTSCPMLP